MSAKPTLSEQMLEKLSKLFNEETNAIHASIRDDDIERLRTLLSASPAPDLGYPDLRHGPPLHFAAWLGNLDAVKLLLGAGANPLVPSKPHLVRDYYGMPVSLAAEQGHLEVVKYLWQCKPPEQQTQCPHRGTPLRSAAYNGHSLVVEFMLSWKGWSMDQKVNALSAAASGSHYVTTKLLLKDSQFTLSTLYHALEDAIEPAHLRRPPSLEDSNAYQNHKQLIELLTDTIEAHPDPIQSPEPHLLNTVASYAYATRALRVLLQKGADPDGQRGSGHGPLHTLASPVPIDRRGKVQRGNIQHDGRRIINEEAIKLLLEYGASVTKQNENGDPAIHLTAYKSDVLTLSLFMSASGNQENGAKLLASMNANQDTLLHCAAAGCRISIMEHLISRGLDVNARNSNGWTPLICALTPTIGGRIALNQAKYDTTTEASVEAAQLLLSHGADPTVITNEGWTSLHALALRCDLDVPGRITNLATQFITQGANPEARAPLPTPRLNESWRMGVRWGHRASATGHLSNMKIQPDLTPLHWSAQHGAVGVVKALLAASVDIATTDEIGVSAMGMALYFTKEPSRAKEAEAIVRLLNGKRVGL